MLKNKSLTEHQNGAESRFIPSRRLLEDDLLKALAIIFVLMQHGLTQTGFGLSAIFPALWIYQAVPIFVILLAFNTANSFSRKNQSSLSSLYTKEYFVRRFWRIIFPALIAIFVSLGMGIYGQLKYHRSWLLFTPFTLLGGFPVPGWGDWFVCFLVQFIIIAPLVFFWHMRHPALTLCLGLFLAIAVNTILLPQVAGSSTVIKEYYESTIIFLLPFISVGFFAADGQKKKKWETIIVLVGAVFGIFYVFNSMFIYNIIGNVYIVGSIYPGKSGFLFYTLFITVLALRFLPKTSENKLILASAKIGQASYHIFLFQVLYFTVNTINSQSRLFVINILSSQLLGAFGFMLIAVGICILGGLAFQKVDNWLQDNIRTKRAVSQS